nr:unnamed protein product [Callosobruchus analis]
MATLVRTRLCSADGNFEVTLATKATIYHQGLVEWKPPAIYKSSCEIDVEYFPFDEQTCVLKFGSWTADGNYEVTLMTKATVYHDGLVVWQPPAVYKSSCAIDVEFFPYDVQTCVLKLGSWTYDGFKVDLRHMDEKAGSNVVEVGVDLSEFYMSVEWDILEVPAVRNEKFYTCCDEPYLDITFNITMRRKTLFYTVNIIIPCMGISFLTVLTFYLPSDSGEKVTLSISILISLHVFFLLVVEIIPPTSLVVPLLGKYLIFAMILLQWNVSSSKLRDIISELPAKVPHLKTRRDQVVVSRPRVGHTLLIRQHLFNRYQPPVCETCEVPTTVKHFLFECNHLRDSRSTKCPLQITTNAQNVAVVNLCQTDTWAGDGNHPVYILTTQRCTERTAAVPKGGSQAGHLVKKNCRQEEAATPTAAEDAGGGGGDRGGGIKSPLLQRIPAYSHSRCPPEVHKTCFCVKEDWKYVAMVLDRLFLWIFTLAVLVGTAGIILQAPTLYDDRIPIDKKFSELATTTVVRCPPPQ